MTNQIVKDILHPENEKDVDIYPKTSIDQVDGFAEEKEVIEEQINETNKKITTGLAEKVDKNELNILDIPNTIPLRDENGRFEVGDTNRPNDALNLKTGKSYFPNIDTPLVEAIETVYGRHNGSNASINVNKLLANVTSPIITITALETATSGSITEQDLATLQGNKNAMILFANEYYYLADDQHTSGYLTYSHVGVENGVQWIKSITITIASLSWVKTVDSIRGNKYKIFIIQFSTKVDNNTHTLKFTFTRENEPQNVFDFLSSAGGLAYYNLTYEIYNNSLSENLLYYDNYIPSDVSNETEIPINNIIYNRTGRESFKFIINSNVETPEFTTIDSINEFNGFL